MQITVAGEGHASLAPERATVTLLIGREGGDLAAVMDSTTRIVTTVTAAVDELRHRDPSPTTWSAVLPIQTRTWRPYSDKGVPMAVRYGATSRVIVTFRDFVELARFVGVHGSVEGVTVAGVEWDLTEASRTQWQASVLQQAVDHARARALVIARAAGEREVRLVEAADPGLLGGQSGRGSVGAPPMARALAASGFAGEAAEGIDLRPEDVVITETIHGRFESAR